MDRADTPYTTFESAGRALVHVRDIRHVGRPMRPFPLFVSVRRRHMVDDLQFVGSVGDRHLDPDCEMGAWPELIDQSRLGSLMADGWYHEDDEVDDEDTGIDDEHHDALEEDGI